MTAKSGLLEEPGHKTVILNHINIFLLQRTLATPEPFGKGSSRIIRTHRVLARVIVVRHPRLLNFELVTP